MYQRRIRVFLQGYFYRLKSPGDFNIDLLKHDSHTPTNEFLYLLSSNMILSYIYTQLELLVTAKLLLIYIF